MAGDAARRPASRPVGSRNGDAQRHGKVAADRAFDACDRSWVRTRSLLSEDTLKPTNAKHRIAAALLAQIACAPAFTSDATAQDYPTKPIRFIVPFAPGGGTDVLARIVAPKMSETLGKQVIVENRTGAGGNLATEQVAKAAPDGYTILLAYIGPIAVSPSLESKLGFDPVKDFTAVSLMATIPLVLVVHPSLPVKSVRELVTLARSRPGQMTYGSAGNGTAQQLAGELFKLLTGTKIVGVPYRGGAPATVGVITGEVDMLFTGALGVFPHIRSGRLRALAVTTSQRLASVPELPTVSEAGVKGFEVTSWNGVLVPAGTPRSIVQKLNASVTDALKIPEVRQRLESQGLQIVASTPEQFGQFIQAEIAKWGKVVRAAGIKPE